MGYCNDPLLYVEHPEPLHSNFDVCGVTQHQ